MSKVAIIGGGASGLIAAIFAADNNEVTVIERNHHCGKKILITGNGKCNYYNDDMNIKHYHSNSINILKKIMKDNAKIPTFFEQLGILPKIKNHYYYPYSNQAASIQMCLVKEAEEKKVTILNDVVVESVTKENHQFMINNDSGLLFDKVILSTGSKASPKTGSDGIGYELASSFGHAIIKPLPALVQLKGNGNFKDWNGIRCDVKITAYEDNKQGRTEIGEIQLTEYGISGICTFNLSGEIARGLNEGKQEYVSINFLPFLNIDDDNEMLTWITNRNQSLKNRNISELFDGILNYKLANTFIKKSLIKLDEKWNEIPDDKKKNLIGNLIHFKLEIVGTNSFENAQVCSGGVPLEEINPNTMESLKEKNLYIIGELLDVNGDCGGYNLSFAFMTGMIAGSSIKGE